MPKSILDIKMLGTFSLSYEGKSVIPENSRENKVLFFLQYLIIQRGRGIPQEELIDVILGDDECTNPINTLKNIVYRARKLFHDAGLEEKKYIYNKSGVYGFAQTMPAVIDIEEFSKTSNAAQNAKNDEKALALSLKAIELYGGDFLPKSYSQIWVIPRAVTYQDMFFANINRAALLLLEKKDYAKMLAVTEKALSLYPFTEKFYILRITAFNEMGRIKEAISTYETACAILFDELGVSPSEELRNVYLKTTACLEEMALTVQDILKDIMETEESGGAYYCSYNMFANTCRFVSRHIERSGQSAFMMLCIFTDLEGSQLSSPALIKDAAKHFHKSSKTSLRRSDIYTRCSPSQFLVLLMGINQENCYIVSKRIQDSMQRFLNANHIKISSSIASVANLPEEDIKTTVKWL